MNLMRTAMLLAAMTALFMGVGYLIGGSGGMMVALLVAAGVNLLSYWNADRMVLAMHGAVEVDERTAPEYVRIVRDLAQQAGLPQPRTFLIDSLQPNAFATGRNPQHAAVAATTGLLQRLTPQEIAGVMAHELAHVRNRDTLTMTIVATLAGAISMLGNFAFFFGGRRDENGLVGTLAAVIVAPLAAAIVQMAVSRTREYAADRGGAEISGRPLWLASALGKIARGVEHIPNADAERAPATAHLFIVNPLSGRGMDGLFSTHPSTENRIAALEAMAREPRFSSQAGGYSPAAAARRPAEPPPSAPTSGPWGPASGGDEAAPSPKNPWGRNPTGPRLP